MQQIPSVAALESELGRYLDAPAVLVMSAWNQPNDDKPFDEEEYLNRAARNGDLLGELLGDGFSE